MGVSSRHILQQGPVLGALARAGWIAATGGSPTGTFEVPGPEFTTTLPPRPSGLIRDYIRHLGGDPGSYRGRVPAHLFPQWVFPLQARGLEGIQYPMHKVLNGGCRIEMKAPIPAGEPLLVSARLQSIDDNGKRAVIHQRSVTGTPSTADALVADMYAIVPLSGPKTDADKKAPRKPKPRVPEGARELAYWNISANAGLDFAKLTGDFNPVHWIAPYAKAAGFRNVILHGFSTFARAIEGMNRGLFAGDVDRLKWIDVKFTRPLVLPARVGLYIDDDNVFVGDAPGGPAYLVGRFGADDQ